MKVRIEVKPGFTVLGMVERGKNGPQFIPPLWQTFFQRIGEVSNLKKSDGVYGVMRNYDETTDEFDYLAGFEVEPGTTPPKGMVTWDIPELTYAVVSCTIGEIGEAYQFFYDHWLPNHGYTHGRYPEGGFEYYFEGCSYEDQQDPMELYFPVEKT
jgi:predicted transcriptional regulator YdeE